MSASETTPRDALAHVAAELPELHRALLAVVRDEYERLHGPVAGPVALWRLVTDHPHFDWLRALSRLMAEIDELLDEKEHPVADEHLAPMRARLEELVANADAGPSSFGGRYAALLQAHPHVIMLHARLRRALDRLPRLPEQRQ